MQALERTVVLDATGSNQHHADRIPSQPLGGSSSSEISTVSSGVILWVLIVLVLLHSFLPKSF